MLVGAASGLPVVDLVSDQLVVGQQPGVLVRERVETRLVFVLVEWLARVERDEIVDRGRSCIDLPGERCLFRFEVTGFEAFKHEGINVDAGLASGGELLERLGECVFDLLIGQVGCGAFFVAGVFVVAPPNPLFIFGSECQVSDPYQDPH